MAQIKLSQVNEVLQTFHFSNTITLNGINGKHINDQSKTIYMDFYIVSAEENLGKIPEYLTLSGCANPPDFEVWLFY